jgi:hypothetical protein
MSQELLLEVNKKLNLECKEGSDINKNIIFVYCPRKVGSTTLVSSIRLSAAKKYTLCHVHGNETILELTGIKNISVMDVIKFNKDQGKEVYVIDIYREPIERKMSEFFELLSILHFNNSEEKISEYDIDKLVRRFNLIFEHISNSDYYFDVYGVNHVDSFDFDNKFLLNELGGIKYIKLRLKDSNLWGKQLSKIFEVKIHIVKDNETSSKIIGELYRKFKESYKLPKNLYEFIAKSKELRFYNTEDEIKEYLNKWKINLTHDVEGMTPSQYEMYEIVSKENSVYKLKDKDHYIDNGCVCIQCSRKRAILLEKVKRGEKINDRIEHGANTVIRVVRPTVHYGTARRQTRVRMTAMNRMGF